MNKLAVATIVVLLGRPLSVEAIQLEAQGELVFDDAVDESTVWTGTFKLEHGALTGTIATTNSDGFSLDTPVFGQMFEDRIVFGSASDLDGQGLEFSSEPLRTNVARGVTMNVWGWPPAIWAITLLLRVSIRITHSFELRGVTIAFRLRAARRAQEGRRKPWIRTCGFPPWAAEA